MLPLSHLPRRDADLQRHAGGAARPDRSGFRQCLLPRGAAAALMHGAGTVHAALRAGVDQGRSVRGLPSELIPFAIYTRCKYLLAAKREPEAKAAAETALSFFPPDEGFSLIHVYLRLICSAALCATGDMHGCEEHLRKTMALRPAARLYHPFAEFPDAAQRTYRIRIAAGISGAEQTHSPTVDALLEKLDGLPQPPHHIQRHRHSLEPRAPSRPPAGRRSHLRGGGRRGSA